MFLAISNKHLANSLNLARKKIGGWGKGVRTRPVLSSSSLSLAKGTFFCSPVFVCLVSCVVAFCCCCCPVLVLWSSAHTHSLSLSLSHHPFVSAGQDCSRNLWLKYCLSQSLPISSCVPLVCYIICVGRCE